MGKQNHIYTGVAVAFLALAASAESQENWFIPPDDKGGLVIIVNGEMEDHSLRITDNSNNLLAEAKGGKEPLVFQVRLPPGPYQVHLPGWKESSLQNLMVSIAESKLTYLEIAPFLTELGPGGIDVRVWPSVFTEAAAVAAEAKFEAFGYLANEPPVNVDPPTDRVIFVNSDPPWPIRPKPKPNEPQPQ